MKKCSACKLTKSASEFSLRTDGTLTSKCKGCVRDYSKAHYKANSEKHNERRLANQRRYRARNRQIIQDAKNRPCADCGNPYPYYVMQFDHRRDKKGDISDMVNWATEAVLRAEIAKCDVVCANCHAIRTHGVD